MFELASILKTIQSHKLYNSIRIVSLIIGFVTSAILLFHVAEELNFDNNVIDQPSLYRVNTDVNISGNQFKTATAPAPLADLMLREFSEVVEVARVLADLPVVVTFNNQKFKEAKFYYSQSSIFSMFDFNFIHGEAQSSLERPNSIVITESVAAKYGEPASLMHKNITINDKAYKITGIITDPERNSHMSPRAFISISSIGTERNVVWSSLNDHSYIRLANGVSKQQIESALPDVHNKFSEEVYARFNAKVVFSLQEVADIHFGEKLRYELDPTKIGDISDIYLSLFVAALIIVLASTNYAILSIAISMKRAKEIGIRKVLGADRQQIMIDSLLESLVLVLGILAVSGVLIYLLIPIFNAEFATTISYSTFFSWEFLAAVLTVSVVVGLVCAWYPALYLSSFEPIKVLKSQQLERSSKFPLRSLLLVVQLLLVVFMIACTWIVSEQFQYLRNTDLGFNHKNIVQLNLGREAKANFEALKQEMRADPDVIEVASATAMPGGGGAMISNSFEIEREEGGTDIRVTKNFMVDDKFDDVAELQMTVGRFFDKQFSTDESGIVVNEAFVKSMGWGNPIGKRMEKILNQNMDKKAFRVIGVVKDFHFRGFYEEIEPLAMTYQKSNALALLRVSESNSPILQMRLRTIFERNIQNQIFEPQYVEDGFYDQYQKEEQKSSVLFFFTTLAIIISVVGVFGIASYDIKQKSKELAIRTVLGASHKELSLLLVNNIFKLIVIANIVALPLAFLFMQDYLKKFAYHIEIGAIPFVVSAAIVILITGLTMSWHIISALRDKPINALRDE